MGKFHFIFALVITLALAAPAVASENVENHSVTSPGEIDAYSRQGTKVVVGFTSEDGGNATATVQCGDPTGGQWTPTVVEGYCYKGEFSYDVPTEDVDRIIATDLAGKTILSRDVVAGTNGKVTKLRYEVSLLAKESDIVTNTYSKCNGAAVKKLTGVSGGDVKRHCVFNYEGADGGIVGVSSDPSENDDMFRIKPGASAYLEYLDRSNNLDNKRLRWLSRPGGSEPLMVPSGPHSGPSAYKDFDIFMRREPGGVSTQDACYPLRISLCQGVTMPPSKPPTRGLCGSAHRNSYATIADIPGSAKCYIGSATEVTETDTTFNWSCKGIPEDQPSDSCEADKETDITRRPPPRCNPETDGSKKLDVLFLADNTGSMGGVIAAVQAKAHSMLSQMAGDNPHFHPLDVRFGVANYLHDPSEGAIGGNPYTLQQSMTPSRSSTQTAIDKWAATGGGDLPEGQFYAFSRLVDASTGWRSDAHHFMIWMGDAPGHTTTVSLEQAKSALQNKYIYTIALNSSGYPESSLDTDGQATAIISATGGIVADISTMSDSQLAELIVKEVYRGFTTTCK